MSKDDKEIYKLEINKDSIEKIKNKNKKSNIKKKKKTN